MTATRRLTAILSIDEREILNFGRQSIPTFVPGHRLNSGPFGTMGVGLPLAVGAKAAKPSAQVICLHGDGSFGQNAMELDTAVRHKLPLLCVISLNGGWTADPERNKPGRDLGYTRYDKTAEALACYAEYVEEPEGIRPALERAWKKVEEGMVGFVKSKPTTAPAPRPGTSPAAKPEPAPPRRKRAAPDAPSCLIEHSAGWCNITPANGTSCLDRVDATGDFTPPSAPRHSPAIT
jgi:thiamine pyrophosphate-dependent acetolactate synthase large subunit-like protein